MFGFLFFFLQIFSCPTIDVISFDDDVVAIGDKVKIYFKLKPLEKKEWPSNNQFDFTGKDDPNVATYSGSKIANEFQFSADTAGIYYFNGVAYGEKNGVVGDGPVSGIGQLIVVKVIDIKPDSHAEKFVANNSNPVYAAVRTFGEDDFVKVTAIFEPSLLNEGGLPSSFVFTGGVDGETKFVRKAPRNKGNSFSFTAKLGTSSITKVVDIVDIDRINPCNGDNVGLEFTIKLITNPIGYEDRVTIKPEDDSKLSIYKKEDKKWYGKGIKTGKIHSVIGELELASESVKKQGYITICDIPIDQLFFTVNIGLFPSNAVTYEGKKINVANIYKIPTDRTSLIVVSCKYDSITTQVGQGVFEDVIAKISMIGGSLNVTRNLGDIVTTDSPPSSVWPLPGGSGGTVYSNSAGVVSPNLTLGVVTLKTTVGNCDGEKLVDSKTFNVISYDEWKKDVLPTLPQ